MQRAIADLVSQLLKVAVLICVVLALVRLSQGFGPVDALLSGATLAVAALPEEFPIVFTFFLGVGVYRLTRRKALVRRAVAVENIGRVTCICSDKTGTITRGELELVHRLPAPGFNPDSLLGVAARAARLDSQDPMDAALLVAAGGSPPVDARLAVFPFTEQRRRETAVWLDASGRRSAFTKGAPETILDLCALSAIERKTWLAQASDYASSGHKVIGCATRLLPPGGDPSIEPAGEFAFAGILGFGDPVREGVREAVAQCRAAGIRVVMVTGDHPATARAVAMDIGLGGTGPKVAVVDADVASETVSAVGEDVDVVARATPRQKLELVRSLQARGEVVAVTGDGVNDVPALQAADIGIAMGERSTRSARETAAIVLLDDNFRTIVRAVAEGRQLFRNLQRGFAYLLMVHVPLVASAALIPLSGAPLLYRPIHIVWLELLIHPTALLVLQDSAKPSSPPSPLPRGDVRFFSRRSWWAIASGGLMITLVVLFSFYGALGEGLGIGHARAMALASLIVAGAMLTASLSGLSSAAAWTMVLAGPVSVALFAEVPALAAMLQLSALHADNWTVAAFAGLLGVWPPRHEVPRTAWALAS